MTAPTARRLPPRAAQEAQAARGRDPEYTMFRDIVTKYDALAGRFPGDAGDLVRGAREALASVTNKTTGTIGQAVREASDPRIPAAGKRKIVAGLADELAAHAAEQLQLAETRLDVAEASLIVQALPKMSKGDEMSARADAQMVLDRVTDPANVPAAMADLAARGDSVGGLVAGDWGRTYLAARGLKPGDHSQVTAAAVHAAKDSPDTTRAEAAEAIGRLGDLRGAVTAAHQMTRHAVTGDLPYIQASGGALSHEAE
jgi:hypothetical protein